MKMCHFREWTEWSDPYEIEYSYGEFGVQRELTQRKRAQERICRKCGKVDERFIGFGKVKP